MPVIKNSAVITGEDNKSLEETVAEMREVLERQRKERYSSFFEEVNYDLSEADVDAEAIVKELEGDEEENSEVSFLEEETLFVVGK